ncbi:MAG: carboxylating.nicotinate-nucleotide diphosphorylase, partial [Candidatus Bathyarchaeota archaeon]
MSMPRGVLQRKLQKLLTEDLGEGDITTELLVQPSTKAKAEIIAKENGILAGIEEAKILFESLGLQINPFRSDGSEIKKGQKIMEIKGNASTILMLERTALNLLTRMSG